MTTEEAYCHDGLPLERTHLKGMAARNALENTAHNKITKRLEMQKKAFVRQNTRDEGEMKCLLQRLQNESQQTTHIEGAQAVEDHEEFDYIDGVNEDEVFNTATPSTPREEPSNPYPITIIPRFGGPPQIKYVSKSTTHIRPDSAKINNRRKSNEFEDVQESMSAMTVIRMSSTTSIPDQASSHSNGHAQHDDWLASPEAISSVRRQRKTVSEQAHRKILLRTSSELNYQLDDAFGSSPSDSPSHSRNNSIKDKHRQVNLKDELMSPRGVGRRGGSLKERKYSSTDEPGTPRHKPVARSFSTLTKMSLTEFNQRQENRKDSHVIRNGSEKSKCSQDNLDNQVKHSRKNSKKSGKQSLVRKSSNDSSTSMDDAAVSSPRGAVGPRRKLGVTNSPDTSPHHSPLVNIGTSFKY